MERQLRIKRKNEAGEVEVKECGREVTIKNYWIRHAQKMSGEIVSSDQTGISTSSISPKGQEESTDLGQTISAKADGAKGYISSSARTGETLENILQGYKESNPGKPIRDMRIRKELTHEFPPKFIKLYDSLFAVEKNRILAEEGRAPEEYSSLSPDEQERIAEAAEEPVIREWLDSPDSELARLYPPQQAAARFAKIFEKHDRRLAHRLFNNSQIDLMHVTHKTVTEPFLVSGVLISPEGDRVTRLEQLGGSLGVLDQWESEVHIDAQGKSRQVVRIRGKEYSIDQKVLSALIK